MSDVGTPKILIHDPFSAAVARYERKQAAMSPPEDSQKPPDRLAEILERLVKLEEEGGGGGTTGDWPLKLVRVDDSNVKVLLGTVAGFTPTDIETPIDVSGTDATWAIVMHATISGTTVTAVEVISEKTGSVPADDATNSYRLIGQADVVSGVITAVRPSMAWSMNVVICTSGTPPYAWMTGA